MEINIAAVAHKALIIFLCLMTIAYEIVVIYRSKRWSAWLVILVSLFWGALYVYSLVTDLLGVQTNLQIWVRSGIAGTMLVFLMKALRVARVYDRKH